MEQQRQPYCVKVLVLLTHISLTQPGSFAQKD